MPAEALPGLGEREKAPVPHGLLWGIVGSGAPLGGALRRSFAVPSCAPTHFMA